MKLGRPVSTRVILYGGSEHVSVCNESVALVESTSQHGSAGLESFQEVQNCVAIGSEKSDERFVRRN